MRVTVLLSSGGRESVVVMDSPTLTVDPDGGLEVTYLSNEDATVTAGHQPSATVAREQYLIAAAD